MFLLKPGSISLKLIWPNIFGVFLLQTDHRASFVAIVAVTKLQSADWNNHLLDLSLLPGHRSCRALVGIQPSREPTSPGLQHQQGLIRSTRIEGAPRGASSERRGSSSGPWYR